MTETQRYIPFNSRSIRSLRPNAPNEVIDAQSYAALMRPSLIRGGKEGPGVLTKEEWFAIVERHFGKVWGRADLRRMRFGRRGTGPKWWNQQAWGQVLLRKQEVFAKRGKYYVFLDPKITDPEWIEYVLAKEPRKIKRKIKRTKSRLVRVKKVPG